jgi:hypothetical protein
VLPNGGCPPTLHHGELRSPINSHHTRRLHGLKDLPSMVTLSGFLLDARAGCEESTGKEAGLLHIEQYGKGVIP